VDLADPDDPAASDRTVRGDSWTAPSLDIHVIEQHRLAVVRNSVRSETLLGIPQDPTTALRTTPSSDGR
jgi:hypothetical protein